MYNFLHNKKILVTGGTGSIGSEIVRQALKHSPAGGRAGEKIVESLMTEEEMRYALELEDMFVIKSLREGVFVKPSKAYKPGEEELCLTKEEIREFLKDELKKV